MSNNHDVPLIPPFGKAVKFADYPADYHGKVEKEEAQAEILALCHEPPQTDPPGVGRCDPPRAG